VSQVADCGPSAQRLIIPRGPQRNVCLERVRERAQEVDHVPARYALPHMHSVTEAVGPPHPHTSLALCCFRVHHLSTLRACDKE
jgi:hypothetical protein